MKTSPIKLVAVNVAMAAMLAMLSGCATKGYDKGAVASDALKSTADAVSKTSTSVTGVLGALNNLTFKSQGDLRNQYEAFVSASKALDSAIANMDEKAAALRLKTADFLSNWTNQLSAIQSDELRQRSAEREAAVSKRISEVQTNYADVKNSLDPFTSDLKDIQTYLGTDLTAGGLDTIKDIVSKTKADAVPLRDSIKNLQATFTSMSEALSPMMPGADQK